MSSISGFNQASLTALSAMNNVGKRIDQISQQVAAGGDESGLAGPITELSQLKVQMKASLLVMGTVQDLAKDLIQAPRK